MCDVDREAVVNAVDVPSIYDIPTMLHDQGLDGYIIEHFGLDAGEVDWTGWRDLLDAVHDPKYEVQIGLVGKYINLPDAYLSVTEALRAGGFAQQTSVKIHWIPSDECATPEGAARLLSNLDGICVPGGFGIRGIEGKVGALKFCRENAIPVLGLCLGLQCMVIEYARNVVGTRRRVLLGVRPGHPAPGDRHDGGAGRHHRRRRPRRHHAARPLPGRPGRGLASCAELYGAPQISERHRHRYEVNNAYREQLTEAGFRFSGISPTASWSSSANCRARRIRSTSARRRIRSCAPGRTGRTRCSAA